MIDVRRLNSTIAQVTGNSGVYVRIDGQLYPVQGCSSDRAGGSIVSRRLVLDVVLPEPVEDPDVDLDVDPEPVAKRRGRPPKVVA